MDRTDRYNLWENGHVSVLQKATEFPFRKEGGSTSFFLWGNCQDFEKGISKNPRFTEVISKSFGREVHLHKKKTEDSGGEGGSPCG